MSIATAAYTRSLLDPRDPEGNPVEPSPSIAALSPRACHLWEVLSQLANTGGHTFPSVETLARRMHVSVDTVGRARAELVAAGVLTVDRGGGRGRSNTYRFPVTAAAVLAAEPPRERGGLRTDDVHNPRAGAGDSQSTTPAPARRNPRAGAAPRDHVGGMVTSTDAVPRGAEPWRQVLNDVMARDDARRAAAGLRALPR